MKMWVSVTSSNEVSNIIKMEELQIESYTERLVNMFNAIVSRDAQSPHGKFYFVTKRLQERFAQIKEGTAKTGADAKDETRRSSKAASKPRSKQSSSNQTPLHLLSEVAMGSSSNTGSQASQPPIQAQQALQQMTHGWHDNSAMSASQQPNMMGIPQGNFDPNFDFTQFDLSMGSDADLSALFIPDGVVWNFTPTTGYNSAF
jgi:hypothetical protein